jgi:hypothetical protein
MDTSGELQSVWNYSGALNSSLEISLNTSFVYAINEFSTEKWDNNNNDNNQPKPKEETKEEDKEMKDESNKPASSSAPKEEEKETPKLKTEGSNAEGKDQPVDTEMIKIEVPEQKDGQGTGTPEGNAA